MPGLRHAQLEPRPVDGTVAQERLAQLDAGLRAVSGRERREHAFGRGTRAAAPERQRAAGGKELPDRSVGPEGLGLGSELPRGRSGERGVHRRLRAIRRALKLQ